MTDVESTINSAKAVYTKEIKILSLMARTRFFFVDSKSVVIALLFSFFLFLSLFLKLVVYLRCSTAPLLLCTSVLFNKFLWRLFAPPIS